jgi:regulator of sirC expression with transglutaminase-like and TPR domain
MALLSCVAPPAFASTGVVSRVEALLETAGDDLARAKVEIDQMIEPRVDVDATLRRIDAWRGIAARRVPLGATAQETLHVLLSTLYAPGPWNDFHPFGYDLDDPLAKKTANRLLSTYLNTRRGNCVSMPVLLVVLGRQLGLPVSLARAPQHLFVKFRTDEGEWLNIEATSGGFKRDESYVRETGISKRAIENGVYLRPLDDRQTIAIFAGDLATLLMRRGDEDAAMALARLALAVDDRDVGAMVRLGSLHGRKAERDFHARWPDPRDVPVDRHDDYRALHRANTAWFAKAEALGWTQPSAAQEAAYLQSIEVERRRRGTPP